MKANYVKRGDVWLADFSLAIGSEQTGVRPCVVLQNNLGNKFSPTIIVAAVSTKVQKVLPTHVRLNPLTCGLKSDSIALMEQIRTIDRARLIQHIGRLDQHDMEQAEQALEISLGLIELPMQQHVAHNREICVV